MPDFLEGNFRTMIGGDSSNNNASTAAVTANRDGSLLERIEDLIDQGERCVASTAQLLVTGTTIFTVAGAPIFISELISICQVASDSTAATLQWNSDPTDGSAATFTGASASRANGAKGSSIICNFTAITTAPDICAQGTGIASIKTNGFIVPVGIITSTVGSGPTTTATYIHYMRFKPMGPGCSVTAS